MRYIDTCVHVLVLASVLCLCCAYDNIALGKNATQEPVNNAAPEWRPDKAVDGNSNNQISGESCAITDPYNNYQKIAVWRVDLGEIKSIYSVRIYYRSESGLLDYRTRFAGFSLYISNTANKDEGHLCYHNTESLPPPIFSQNCTVYGQFVIIYNERKPGITYPGNYSEIAILELCEVEVFGCNRNYGPTCSKPCPEDCKTSACDVFDGSCVSCKDGFTGYNCTQECPVGTYGAGCSGECSKYCARSGRCHHVTGYCPDGCKEGWMDDRCETECDSGKYGRECENTCGHCRGGLPCDKNTGRCLECEPGYVLPNCHDKCLSGKYGLNCNRECGYCHNDRVCNHVTGYCNLGCADGWRNIKCDKECVTSYYGKNCSKSCSSHCKGGRLCHHVTGSCDQGCLSGFYGYTCESLNPVQHDNTTKTEPGKCEEGESCTCTVTLVSAVVEGVLIGLGGVSISVYFVRRGRQQLTSGALRQANNDSEGNDYSRRCRPAEMDMNNIDGDMNYMQIDDMNRNSREYENT